MEALAKIGETRPQAFYRCHTIAMQHKSTYLQRTVTATEDEFASLEGAIRTKTLLTITGRALITDREREMLRLPARKGGLGISDPTKCARPNYSTSKASTKHLVEALIGKVQFDVSKHTKTFAQAVQENKKCANLTSDEIAKSLIHDEGPGELPQQTKRAFERANTHHTSGWLTIAPSTEHGTALPKEPFQDGIAHRYAWEPPNAPLLCDACHIPMTMEHAQTCIKGPHRIARHNHLRDVLLSCLQRAPHEDVRRECPLPPLIQRAHQSNANANAAKNNPNRAAGKCTKGVHEAAVDIRVKGLTNIGSVHDIDVRIMHLDSASYAGKSTEAAFDIAVKEKKAKYEATCKELNHTFVPFVVSTDGVLSEPAKTFLGTVAEKIAIKSQTGRGIVKAFVRAQIAVALVKGISRCLRGSRVRDHGRDRPKANEHFINAGEMRYMLSNTTRHLPSVG